MEQLGLSRTSDAAYRVALAQGRWPRDQLVAQVAQSAQLPQGAAEAAVMALVEFGLLRPSAEAADTSLRVVAPTVVLESRLAAARRGLIARQQRLDDEAAYLAELQQSYTVARRAHVEDSIEGLSGLDAVRGRLEVLAQEARFEALSFMRGTQSVESMQASRPLDEGALARGVNLRNVHLHSALNDPATLAYLRRLGELGGETRTVATLPLQMLIVDREVAVVPIDAENVRAGALVVSSPGILTALLALFESVWLNARVLGERRRTEVADLSDTDREILRILATGATDEGVARQLGVSVRTVRRLTSVLMARFQATSRFELGLRLGSAGVVAAGDRPVAR